MPSIFFRLDEIKIMILLASIICSAFAFAGETVSQAIALRCEHLTNPAGVERKQPRLSWQMKAVKGSKSQAVTAYRVLVAGRPEVLAGNRGDLWDSGKIEGVQPVTIAYAGAALQSLQSCYWKVKIWDEKGREQSWSEPAHWFMGILDERDWQGDWIGYTAESTPNPFRTESFDSARWIWYGADDPINPPAKVRYFRKMIDIDNLQELQWAEMICTTNDAFQLFLNSHLLTPVKMVFDAADSIPRFNIKPFLRSGQNEITIVAEKFVPAFTHVSIRPVAGVIAVIKIKRSGGQVETIVTDAGWQARRTVDESWQAAKDLAAAGSHWRHMPGWRQDHPSPVFRKAFTAEHVREAKIAISGLGYYELYCNGRRVGDRVLDPVFTNYDHRVAYVCYDITEMINRGDNVLGVMLGNGWYNMHTRATWNFDKAPWRDEPKLRALLQLTFSDGSSQRIVSDASWRANTGPVVLDGIHNGEVYDSRLEIAGWNTTTFHDGDWPRARVVAAPKGRLTAQVMPAMKVMETVVPLRITEPDSSIFVVDMGRNMAGWARIKVHGPAGTRIRLRFSERLDSRGRINELCNSRYMFQGPFQTDTFILKGEGVETWEPRFTHHGFRYVEVTGWPGTPTADQINGRVVHTAFARTGYFICSDTLLNKIAIMADRSYRSNFVGYPTDCPQREKNGWTGDAHLAMEQAMYNYSNISAYESWCQELADSRTAEGDLPGIVPTGGWGYDPDNGPGWGSAAVIIPWYLYQYTGDLHMLIDHYDLMKGYVDFLDKKFPDHIVEMCRGDWVYLHTKTPPRVTSTALYYYDSRLLAAAASLLNKKEEGAHYQQLAGEIKTVYNQRFYRGQGLYDVAGQTAQAMALYYDLAPDGEKRATADALAEAVHRAKDHIDCGFLGMKALFQALSENSFHPLAYTVATQRDFPGYGDWISRGATSLWEDWTDTEGSLNHDALGDIVTWFYRSLAGINADPEQPGFRHIIFQPKPVDGLTFVRAGVESTFGPISSEWKNQKGAFILHVNIPPNTTAKVEMPDGIVHNIASGTYEFACKLD